MHNDFLISYYRARLSELSGLVSAMKPVGWLKSLALMLIAAVYALDDLPPASTFLFGALLVGPLLWGGLYLLNNITDIEDDRRHPLKMDRPLPSGRVSRGVAGSVALLLIGTALTLSLQVNPYFFACVFLMTLKQTLYTLPPFRFKDRFILDVVSGSLFNSTLRFLSGWFLVTTTFNFPILFLIFAESLQISGFLSTRVHSDGPERLEARNGGRSTVTVIPRNHLKLLSASLIVISVLSYSLGAVNSMLRLAPKRLGVLPIQSLWILAAVLVGAAASLAALRDAESLSASRAKSFHDYSHLFVFLLSAALAAVIVMY